jgi:hypothetical protein
MALMPRQPAVAEAIRERLHLSAGTAITVQLAASYCAAIALEFEVERFRRDGWKVEAADVHGLPWTGTRKLRSTHGTWGYHEACNTLQRMKLGNPYCVTCGKAGDNDPYLLYLVHHRGLLKFGIGHELRVRAHVVAGADVVQVLKGRRIDVCRAEQSLKLRHHAATKRVSARRRKRMPYTFGKGTEVVLRSVKVDLVTELPTGLDVTRRSARGIDG